MEYIELLTALTTLRNLFKADERVNRRKRFPLGEPICSHFQCTRARARVRAYRVELFPAEIKSENENRQFSSSCADAPTKIRSNG